jgi:hypothetical protein
MTSMTLWTDNPAHTARIRSNGPLSVNRLPALLLCFAATRGRANPLGGYKACATSGLYCTRPDGEIRRLSRIFEPVMGLSDLPALPEGGEITHQ